MKKSGKSKSPSQLIDARIRELDDWRGQMLSRLRSLVKKADPDVVEEWKWRACIGLVSTLPAPAALVACPLYQHRERRRICSPEHRSLVSPGGAQWIQGQLSPPMHLRTSSTLPQHCRQPRPFAGNR